MPAEAGASSAVATQLIEADLVLIEPGSKGVLSPKRPGGTSAAAEVYKLDRAS